MTLEREERFTYVEAIAELRRRLAEPADEESAAADLAGLIAVEQALDEFDAGVHPFGVQTFFEGTWEPLLGVGSGEELLELLIPDPRHRARQSPPMSLETADAIVATFRLGILGDSPFKDLLERMSDADRDDLSHTARRLHELRHAPVADGQSVGVLMPLRLETRFFEPEQPDAPWRLRLRIFPEEASFDRDPGPPTTDEAAHTAVMWQRCDGDLTTPAGRAAFGDLAAKVGGPRAAWLARTLPADGVGADRPRTFSRPRGLPPALMVFLARGGGEPELVEVLSLDRETIAAHMDLNALYEQVGNPDEPPPDTWWTSFSEAKFVGLAADLDIGESPDDIDAIYVTGLGDEEPGPLLRAHAANGRLAVVAPGTPTNSVAGDPAADLGRDPDGWWRLATSSGFDQPAVRDLDLALLGGAHLGPLAGGELDPQPTREALCSALFPVVAGRMLKDQWNLGLGVWDVGRWTRRCLAPEGPFPAIRVADQPYGVLPVTAILPEPATGRLRWVAHPADPPIEGRALVPALSALLPAWAAVAEADGNVVDADTERLLDLIGRTPVTGSWARRIVVAVDILRALGFAFAAGGLVDELERAWADEVDGIDPPVLPAPARRLIPFGDAAWLPEDLTAGTSVPTIRRLLDAPNAQLVNVADPDWAADGMPAPLQARLVRHALVLTNAELTRLRVDELWAPWEPAFMPPIARPEWLADLARQDLRDQRVVQDQRRIDAVNDGGRDITLSSTPDPEGIVKIARGWEAVRDGAEALASGELDEAALDRGLRSLLDATSHRLDPWLTGVAARRLRWLQSRGVPWRLGAYGWVDAPRPGRREELRPGPTVAGLLHAPSHTQALTAALLRDRAVREQDVGRWNLTLDSDRVRIADRLAGQVRAGVHVKEALGRLVEELVGVPGVVAELRRRPEFRMRPEHAGRRVCDGEAVVRAAVENPASLPAGVPVAEVANLQDVLDTYGDLLVADGLFDVVSGRPDRAAEAMEAAAGLGPPSDLRVLRTPREGRALSTAVLAVLPADPPLNGAAPGALADPIFAALLERETGDRAGVGWRWTVGAATVSLADLGLAPVDVLTVPAGALAARVRGEAAAVDDAPIAGPPALRTAHELAELLAGQDAPPATLLGLDAQADAIAQDLRARIAGLRTAAGALAGVLETAPTPAALAEAERWGVQANDGTIAERAAAAAAVLRKRLGTDDEAAGGAPAGLLDRVRAVAGAAGLPVVCRVARSALDAAPADGGRLRDGAAAGLDEEWLDVTAAVRPPLARLEAWQLARSPGRWHAWSTHAGDPWRADWLAANAARRDATPSEQVIAYGPAAALDREHVGVLLLDRFAETVPSSTHATSAAFGFNGPKSRAPQAILLAVPPDLDMPLDAEGIVPILAETRLLARARMATPDALARYRIPLPTTLLLGWGAGERFANIDLEQVKPR